MAGLPKTIVLKTNETVEAITDELGEVIQAVKKVLQDTPPELAADIIDRGIVLAGGGGLLKNLDQLISRSVGVPCYVADDPLLCVSRGTSKILDSLDVYKKSIITKG